MRFRSCMKRRRARNVMPICGNSGNRKTCSISRSLLDKNRYNRCEKIQNVMYIPGVVYYPLLGILRKHSANLLHLLAEQKFIQFFLM